MRQEKDIIFSTVFTMSAEVIQVPEIQVNYQSIVYEAKNGYCTYTNTASNDGSKQKYRRKKCKATPQAVAAVNKKNSIELCRDIVNANFEPTDWELTFTFPADWNDQERIKQFYNAGRRLRSLHNKKGRDYVYIYALGRGEINRQLHVHKGMKRYDNISMQDINKVVTMNGKYPISVHFKKIHDFPVYSTDQQTKVLNEFADYLCKNYDELSDEDRTAIKHRWYGSQGLEHKKTENLDDKPEECGSLGDVTITNSDEHDRHIGGNPRKQNEKLIELYKCGMLNDKIFNRIIGFRKPRYHIVEGSVRLIYDGFGHTNIYMQLIKLGSEIDVKYNPHRAKPKEYIHIYKPKVVNGIDFGLFRCNWEAIPI